MLLRDAHHGRGQAQTHLCPTGMPVWEGIPPSHVLSCLRRAEIVLRRLEAFSSHLTTIRLRIGILGLAHVESLGPAVVAGLPYAGYDCHEPLEVGWWGPLIVGCLVR